MFKWILDKLDKGTVIYYPGCYSSYKLPFIAENYKKLLKILEINFVVLDDLKCCGLPALEAGYSEDFEDLKKFNVDVLDKVGVSKLITNCPRCAGVLSQYPVNMKVEHIVVSLLKNVNKLGMLKRDGERITYFDSCHMVRYLYLTEEPRMLLSELGFEIVELDKNKKESYCCGSGGGLSRNAPKLAAKMARNLLSKVETSSLVTPCPECYAHLKKYAEEFNIRVYELSELLLGNHSIKEKKDEKVIYEKGGKDD